MNYRIRPISKDKVRLFIQEHHRHNEAPNISQVTLAVALEEDGELIAVATAGRPVARLLNDGLTLEINRVCVRGSHRNANTALYGAIGRAAKALGYERLVTYTLQSESGSSLKAAGFSGPIPIKGRSWEASSPGRVGVSLDYTIWGERRQAQNEPKYRWERALNVRVDSAAISHSSTEDAA